MAVTPPPPPTNRVGGGGWMCLANQVLVRIMIIICYCGYLMVPNNLFNQEAINVLSQETIKSLQVRKIHR